MEIDESRSSEALVFFNITSLCQTSETKTLNKCSRESMIIYVTSNVCAIPGIHSTT